MVANPQWEKVEEIRDLSLGVCLGSQKMMLKLDWFPPWEIGATMYSILYL